MADKVAQLASPDIVRLCPLIGRIAEIWQDEELLRETADLMSELLEHAADGGLLVAAVRYGEACAVGGVSEVPTSSSRVSTEQNRQRQVDD